jgi:hypothetical protein
MNEVQDVEAHYAWRQPEENQRGVAKAETVGTDYETEQRKERQEEDDEPHIS